MLIPAALPFFTIASLVAFAIGGLVGLVFGTIDVVMLRLARSAAGPAGPGATRISGLPEQRGIPGARH